MGHSILERLDLKWNTMADSPCYVWDFTLSYLDGKNTPRDVDVLKEDLSKLAKKWAFQLEKGEQTGYEHFQGRLSLKEKVRQTSLKSKFNGLGYQGIHLSRTSSACKADEFYVMKEDTRIDGPWTDAMIAKKNVRVPRDVAYMNKVGLRPFQQDILNAVQEYDEDIVDVVIHPKGMAGKSLIVKKMCIDGMGEELPFCNDFRDVMRMAYDVQTAYSRRHLKDCPAFFIDMPRATNKDKLFQLYAAIENLKRGKAYDDRYAFKRCYFDPPRIFVFTNTKPDMSLLTYERWRLWTISSDHRLIPYVEHSEFLEKTDSEFDDEVSSYSNIEEDTMSDVPRSDDVGTESSIDDNLDYDELDLDITGSN